MKQLTLVKLATAAGGKVARQTLHLRLTQRSRLEALSRVAEQAGMELRRSLPGTMALAWALRAWTAAAEGVRRPRAALVVAEQKENATQATGVLALAADYPSLPPVVRLLLKRAGLTLSDLQVRSKGGDDLLFARRLRHRRPTRCRRTSSCRCGV